MKSTDYDVLFVDDDVNILNAIKRNLHGRFHVCAACTIEEAVGLLDRNQFPVIISDMKMPEMNGADFLILVKEKSPESIRVLLTGETNINDAIKAINESDIYKILIKPCSPENLCSTIDSALKLFHAQKLEEMLMDKSLKGFIYVILDLLSAVAPEVFKRSVDITKIANSPKTSFPVNDQWSFEIAALLMYLGAIHFRVSKFEEIYEHENMEKILRKSASIIGRIPKFEGVYSILNDLAEFYHSNTAINELSSDSRILKLLVDYHSLISDPKLNEKLRLLYSKNIISSLPVYFGKKPAVRSVKELTAGHIKTGMVTAEDILTQSGSIIIFNGDTITEKHLNTLQVLAEKEFLIEPLKIFEK